jgi:thiol-disulfide isomerase/thioredoxin
VGKLRGKVVLIDFWATWCGPCMAEAPNVVEAYNDLHGKGLEIVGISLDQDKGRLDAVTKVKGMVWPQYFDGKGWENAISSSYGITSIPSMWLVDKKGMIVDSDARDGLKEKIEKLLAE